MATFTMLPDAVTGTNEWGRSHIFTSYEDIVASDDSVNILETINSHEITFTFANPSVAEEDIDSITSSRIVLKARYSSLAGTTDLDVYQVDTSGNDDSGETHTIAASGSFNTVTGTSRTTAPDGGSWTYADLENLRVRLDKNGSTHPRRPIRVSYLYAEVTYVAADAEDVTDNATFFGANF